MDTGAASTSGGGSGSANLIDVGAQIAAKQQRVMGAGDAAEFVRVKHLATQRYLCVGKDCDCFFEPTQESSGEKYMDGQKYQRSPQSQASKATRSQQSKETERWEPEERQEDEEVLTRVGMITIARYAAVPASTVFVLRPRAVGRSAAAMTAAEAGLCPEDLVHLQHKDTGLFLSALPHGDAFGGGEDKKWGQRSSGGRIGLTMVKSPLTTEVSEPCNLFTRDRVKRWRRNQIMSTLRVVGVDRAPDKGQTAVLLSHLST